MPVQEARHFSFVNSLYPFERSDRLGATGTGVKCCVWRPARLLTSEETDSHRVTGCLVNGLLWLGTSLVPVNVLWKFWSVVLRFY